MTALLFYSAMNNLLNKLRDRRICIHSYITGTFHHIITYFESSLHHKYMIQNIFVLQCDNLAITYSTESIIDSLLTSVYNMPDKCNHYCFDVRHGWCESVQNYYSKACTFFV